MTKRLVPNKHNKFSALIMLSITPFFASLGLVIYDPSNWGGSIKIENILIIAVFGIITVQLWPTYISSIILTPIIMKKLNFHPQFYTIGVWKFLGLSVVGGILAGQFILFPCIIMSAIESTQIALNWIFSGVVAGIATFPIIALMYRFSAKHEQ